MIVYIVVYVTNLAHRNFHFSVNSCSDSQSWVSFWKSSAHYVVLNPRITWIVWPSMLMALVERKFIILVYMLCILFEFSQV